MTVKNASAPNAAGVSKPLRGTVVFYNKDKGYGFIRTKEESDYFFGYRAFSGTKLPEAGDLVEFTVSPRPPKPGKSPNVEHLEIVGKDNDFSDSKVTCPHCGKRVLPRITTYYGRPSESYCPLCGGKIKDFNHDDSGIGWHPGGLAIIVGIGLLLVFFSVA